MNPKRERHRRLQVYTGAAVRYFSTQLRGGYHEPTAVASQATSRLAAMLDRYVRLEDLLCSRGSVHLADTVVQRLLDELDELRAGVDLEYVGTPRGAAQARR